MKKTYTTPTVEITRYDVEDVLLASGGMLKFLSKQEENTAATPIDKWC